MYTQDSSCLDDDDDDNDESVASYSVSNNGNKATGASLSVPSIPANRSEFLSTNSNSLSGFAFTGSSHNLRIASSSSSSQIDAFLQPPAPARPMLISAYGSNAKALKSDSYIYGIESVASSDEDEEQAVNAPLFPLPGAKETKGIDIVRRASVSLTPVGSPTTPTMINRRMRSMSSPALFPENENIFEVYHSKRKTWKFLEEVLSSNANTNNSGSNLSYSQPPSMQSFLFNNHTNILDVDWNFELQSLLENWQFEYDSEKSTWRSIQNLVGLAGKIELLVNDFITEVKETAIQIVSERQLPPNSRTLKTVNIGGIAGGEKYLKNNIIYKFPCDSLIYGDERFAAKAAKHELMGFNALQIGRMFYSKDIGGTVKFPCFPMCCLVKYGGYTILASTKVPINKTSLLYGSSDGGNSFLESDTEVKELAHNMFQRLKLKGHYTKLNNFILGPADIEIHMGLDGRYYFIDPARLFPPLKPVGSVRQGQHLYRHFRPEFLINYETPLSSDAYSEFQAGGKAENNEEINQATLHLRRITIPSFVREINAHYRLLYGEDDHIPFTSNEAENFVLQMHIKGINCEFLNKIYKELVVTPNSFEPLKMFVLQEMIARAMKIDLSSYVRSQLDKQLKDRFYGIAYYNQITKRAFSTRLNAYFKHVDPPVEASEVWGRLSTQLELFEIELRTLLEDRHYEALFNRLQDLVGFKADPAAFNEHRNFIELDIIEIVPKVKYASPFSYMVGFACFEAAMLQNDPEAKESFLLKAAEHYQMALRTYPGDWIAFCNSSSTLYHLSTIESFPIETRKQYLIEADIQAYNAYILNKKSKRTLSNWGIILKVMGDSYFQNQRDKLYNTAIIKQCEALDDDLFDSNTHENLALVFFSKARATQDLESLECFKSSFWHITTAIKLSSEQRISLYRNLAMIAIMYVKKLKERLPQNYDEASRACWMTDNVLMRYQGVLPPNLVFTWASILYSQALLDTPDRLLLVRACDLCSQIEDRMEAAQRMKSSITHWLRANS